MSKKKTIKVNKTTAQKNSNSRQASISDAQIIRDDLRRIIKGIPSSARSAGLNIKVAFTKFFGRILSIPSNIIRFPKQLQQRRKADLKKKKYRSFRLQKKISADLRYLPSAKLLLWSSIKFFGRNYSLIAKIALIHVALYMVFVKTPTTTLTVDEIKETVNVALGEGGDKTLNGTLATFSTVVGLNATNGINSAKASVLILLISLIYIWAIRQTANGHKVKARDAYYQGFAPLITALMILVVMALQLLPFALVSFLYSVARTGGIFVSGVEDMSFFIATTLVGVLSFYFVTSTIIALYIATLPGMYPMQAFVSAKRLVHFQRVRVFKRVIALPLFLGITYVLLLLLFIRFFPGVTLYFTEAFPLLVLPVVHTYYYKLYRALI